MRAGRQVSGQRRRRTLLAYCGSGTGIEDRRFERCLSILEEALSQGWTAHLAGTFPGDFSKDLRGLASRVELVSLLPGELSTYARDLKPGVVHLDSTDHRLDPLADSEHFISNIQEGPSGARDADLVVDIEPGAEYRFKPNRAYQPVLLGDSAAFEAAEEVPAADDSVPHPGIQCRDGMGAWRSVRAWDVMTNPRTRKEIASMESLPEVRSAVIEDAEMLFAWRNDLESRAASRTGDRLEWHSHLAWTEKVIESPHRHMLIAEIDGQPIGMRRFDHLHGIQWESSTNLNPAFRGEGLAVPFRVATDRAFAKRLPDHPIQLFSTVHESNVASRLMILQTGALPYLPADQDGFETFLTWFLPDCSDGTDPLRE